MHSLSIQLHALCYLSSRSILLVEKDLLLKKCPKPLSDNAGKIKMDINRHPYL